MPVYANTESLELWSAIAKPARSLAASRFVSIASDKDDKKWRGESCAAIKIGASLPDKLASHSTFCDSLEELSGKTIHAKLEARLIIDAAGGVLENGGICLDRTSGIPFIPGSAVKGAARRYAIRELSEKEDPREKMELLYRISRVFGFGDQEWKKGRHEKGHSFSDFWLAMAPLESGEESDTQRNQLWDKVAEEVAGKFFKLLKKTPKKEDLSLHSQLPNFAGTICFLPAFPERDPGIDIDVLTCHHPKYYDKKQEVATDDESPNPVLFPTIAAGSIFRFPLFRTQLADNNDLRDADKWLSQTLEVFGIGAKTNAGYGWFSIDHHAQKEREEAKRKRQTEEAEKAKLEAMSPRERAAYNIGNLSDSEFSSRVRDLNDQPEDEQSVICELLISTKVELWKRWNKKGAKKWQPRLPGIREIAQKHGIELP